MAFADLQLGDVTFQGITAPEVISWGGDQALAVQKLIGGARVIDAMGRDDAPLTWDGIFMGANALSSAQYLNGMRVAGKQVDCLWGGLSFTAVIKSFKAEYRFAGFHIPYSITLEIITDNVTSSTPTLTTDVNTQMNNDMTSASGLGGSVGDPTLSGMLGTLQSAVSAVSSFATAGAKTVASVLTPLLAVTTRNTALFSAAQNAANGVTAPGGVLPGAPPAQSIAALTTQIAAFQQQSNCFALQSVCGRMAQNVSSIGTNANSVTQGGGNLFSLAANYYGDATKWDTIANANGLSDPQLSGINTIVIPANPGNGSTGGVLGVS